MKVIFLDFDGVINNWDHFDGVDYNNVKFLLEIIKSTDAKVVATTSHKYTFQRNPGIDYKDTNYFRYVTVLMDMGIEIFQITPYVDGNRELEIKEYLKTHPNIEQFLILDDEYVGDSLKEHQVLLELYNGICEEHVKPSLNILNGKLGLYPSDYDTSITSEESLIRINKYHNSRR